jgi:hypothetical protein
MSFAPSATIFLHSLVLLLYASLIPIERHVLHPPKIPHQSTQSKHHITPLILKLIPVLCLTQLHHLIPNIHQPLPQIPLLIPHTTAKIILHSTFYIYQFSIFIKSVQFFMKISNVKPDFSITFSMSLFVVMMSILVQVTFSKNIGF